MKTLVGLTTAEESVFLFNSTIMCACVFFFFNIFMGCIYFASDISKEMAIDSYDIVSTLQALGMMKYWKGKHIILKKQVSFSKV